MPITTSATTIITHHGAALVGRVLLALLFIISGFGKIGGFEGITGAIASKGLPVPQVLAALTVLIELGGGLMLAIGWKARWAALAIAGFTLLASVLYHPFWAVPPEQYMNQFTAFWKNISIVGGMLLVFAFGAGRYSVDRR
jgi:putative oxidoreductase